ncbi:aldo/keto reductase [Ectothiorhodospiraceae bacterium WFHF3C12]|nr:aldo/keto reductase [Ectothiorhodospiraceae bacterium WFHF3C12]
MDERHTRPPRNGGLNRRQFLKASAGAAALGAMGPVPLWAASDTLIRRPIPASGEQIPVIGLGTARTFNVDDSDAEAMAPLRGVMKAFYEGGGRMVDSSPMYGNSETVVGVLARDLGIADELFMATKVWTDGAQAGVEQMQRSRERMGGGRLELIQVHNLRDLRTQLDTLKRWRDEGKVRYIGVTHSRNSAHGDLKRVVEREPLDFVQLNYNIAARNAERRLLPAAANQGVAVIVNEPFESGRLFSAVRGQSLPDWARDAGAQSWAQYFLKYIVSHPAVTCAIPATSDPEHSRDNIGACHGVLPDSAQRRRMVEYFEGL